MDVSMDRSPGATRSQQLAGLALVAMAAGFMTVIMLAASMAPDYDFAGGAISDLGVIPETALLFNLSLVAVGGLNVVAGWLLFAGRGNLPGLVVFLVAGVGAVGAALFPLDRGGLHTIFALLAFVAFNLEPVVIGLESHRALRVISILVAIVGLAFVVLMVVGDGGNPAAFGPINHGGTERMIIYPVMLWLLAYGGYLTAQRRG